LLINFFHFWWPDLLKEGFLKEFVTPIVKVSKAGQKVSFFTQNEYEAWKEKHEGGKGWNMKYYKGLGTSTAAEAKEYFTAMEEHRLGFTWKSNKDGELIDMAFSKSRADDRKKWMNDYVEGTYVDHSQPSVSYEDFIKLELVQFSKYSVMRSVPSIMDGFKPSQRKVLYSCFKRNLTRDCKVAQMVGYVGEHSAYHHGEMSLAGTIISMAQDFVGSNNLNLLVPSGQFGTRSQGGSDHASARYIYTRLEEVTRAIFHPLDDPILAYQDEDGQKIEPVYYVPIIPMVLVNGAAGIGTGWSTDVPNYDPLAIIANLRMFMRGKKMKPLKPWYRGFQGSIKSTGRGTFASWGKAHQTDKGKVMDMEITELPIRKWTQDYKEFLQAMLPGAEGKTKMNIEDFKEYHTERTVHFQLKMSDEQMKEAKTQGIEKAFKLHNSINETNMMLFDNESKIQKYKNPVDIMNEFARIRLKFYVTRKEYLVHKLTLERDLLNNRARFIKMIIEKKLKINNRKKAEVVKDLTRLKFQKFGDTKPPRTGFEYLLIMQIASLTLERRLELERMAREKAAELKKVQATAPKQMWTNDLDVLEAMILDLWAKDAEFDPKASKGKKGKKEKGGKRRRDAGDDEEDDGDGAGGGDEEAAAANDPTDNGFSDISRWTAGSLKFGASSGEKSTKKRRTK